MTGHPLDTRLAQLDRGQLVALVKRLVSRRPDLQELVLLPLPGERRPVAARHVAVAAARILDSMGDDWQASSRAEEELWPLLTIGDQRLECGALADARTVFVAVIQAVLPRYGQLYDYESEIAGIVDECVKGLGACLDRSPEPGQRYLLLRDIFAVYRWDALGQGGYGMDTIPCEILIGKTGTDERRAVAGWVREALSSVEVEPGRRRRQEGGRLVLKLIGSELDDAGRERIFTEASLDGPLIDLLLAQGREREAIELVRGADGDSLIGLATRLVEAGFETAAYAAVADNPAVLALSGDRVRGWLQERGVALPANLDDLVRTMSGFQVRPSVGRYKMLRAEAEAADRWPMVLALAGDIRPDLKGLTHIRARVQADRGAVEQALAELGQLSGSTWKSAAADVARSIEDIDPAVAADLYRRLLDSLPAGRSKSARAKAAALSERLAAMERAVGSTTAPSSS